MSNKITFDVGFKANQSDLQKLRKSLTDISAMTSKQLKPQFGDQALNELTKVKRTAREVELALNKAFNPNLGSLNVSKLNQQLNKIGINKIATQFAELGATGRNAFNNLAATALTTNTKLNQTYGILDKIKTTLGNSLRWSLASSVINRMTNEIGNAFAYVKSLDASLNDIRIVTGKSADEMSNFAVEANKAAKALGQQTTAYTNAALIYYQQGLNTDQANALAETTLKVANVTGQDTAAVSEELTAVMNGYQIAAQNVEGAFDSLAAVAATTAADLEELTTGMSKVAAAANSMGVGMDSLNAQVATIVSVTRQAPESVGTALKTIYARLGDLKVDGVDEFGTSLGQVSGTLQKMGINVLDQMGNLRDMEGVITEVAEKWNTWTGAQRQAAAVAMAGKRLVNWRWYTEMCA